MDDGFLRALNAARTEGQAPVVVTDVESGAQALLIGAAQTAGTLTMDPVLWEAAQAARTTDRSKAVELETDRRRYLVQPFNPPLRMLIVGAVHIAQALAPMAAIAGHAVTVIDPRGAWATPERFPGLIIRDDWPDEAMEDLKPDARTAVVTLTHDPKLDDPALLAALRSPAYYVGALGSRKTHAKRVDRLTAAGLSAEQIAKIDAPVGMDIGAASPSEIAVSILAQVILSLRGSKASRKGADAA